MNCTFNFTGEETEGRFLHKCSACGREVWSVYPDPKRVKGMCESLPGMEKLKPIPPPDGPGSEMYKLIRELGIEKTDNCGCGALVAQMNEWGIEGCLGEHRDEIIVAVNQNYHTLTWLETFNAGWRGKWTINIFDPIGSILEESCRRANIPRPVYVNLDEIGWGDIAICAYISEGTKKTTRPLIMAATGHKAEHIKMLGLPVVDPKEVKFKVPWSGPAEMKDGKTPRLKFYADWHGVPNTPQKPKLNLPHKYECKDPSVDKKTVLCFPTSTGVDREWAIPYWNTLCEGLVAAGLKPMVFPARHLERYTHVVNLAPMGRLVGYMKKAGMFIGVDSGPANWAALVDLPGVVLLGPTKPLVFEHAPLFKCLQSDLSCTGCCFKRVNDLCGAACLSLANIKPERVLDETLRYHGLLYPNRPLGS